MRRIVASLAFSGAWLLSPTVATALSSDRDQLITIEANWAEADDGRGVTMYKGRVVINQGTLRISGDTATVHYDQNQDLTTLIVVGQPAHFQQKVEDQREYQQATAKRMEYHADKNVVILLGDARSWQGQDQIRGDRIVFDTVHNRVQADARESAKASGSSRVRITIMPKKD